MRWFKFSSQTHLIQELSGKITSLLDISIREKGRASLVVSGGSTPVPLFEELARQEIDWSRVYITLADERWVPPSHNDSNEGLVRRHLLKERAQKAIFVGLYTGAKDAKQGEKECEERVRTIGPPFDLLILGMGSDGHTASLFPGADNLASAVNLESDRVCMAISPADAPHERMTLTLQALLKSRNIFLHITGEEKIQVLQKALSQGPVEQMPIRFVLSCAKGPVNIYWAP